MPVKTPPTTPKQAQQQADAQLNALGDIKAEMTPLEKKEKEIKAELTKWAERNRALFAEANSCKLEHGMLTYQQRAELEYGSEWHPKALANKYPQLLKADTTGIKKQLDKDPGFADIMAKADILLTSKEVLQIKANT